MSFGVVFMVEGLCDLWWACGGSADFAVSVQKDYLSGSSAKCSDFPVFSTPRPTFNRDKLLFFTTCNFLNVWYSIGVQRTQAQRTRRKPFVP